MSRTLLPTHLKLVLLLVACGGAAAQDAPMAAQCGRIDDVQLDHEVAREGEHLYFSRRDERIDVTPGTVANAEGRWTVTAAARYHADLQRFLDSSTAVAEQARPLTKLLRGPTPELARAALDACSAVLALAESTRAVEAAAPGFRSPVRIRLEQDL